MLNSSVEVNIITRALTNKARLTVLINLVLLLKIVLREIRRFNKAYKDIEVSISSIVNV